METPDAGPSEKTDRDSEPAPSPPRDIEGTFNLLQLLDTICYGIVNS